MAKLGTADVMNDILRSFFLGCIVDVDSVVLQRVVFSGVAGECRVRTYTMLSASLDSISTLRHSHGGLDVTIAFASNENSTLKRTPRPACF
jgi:hypothetical protein